jgi:hypothetical protein
MVAPFLFVICRPPFDSCTAWYPQNGRAVEFAASYSGKSSYHVMIDIMVVRLLRQAMAAPSVKGIRSNLNLLGMYYAYFTNRYFAVLHTSATLTFIYCR